mmetsp:Transcript_32747/g.78305  ORF Transcript_32747/g.78305 Transcript_32747/m.78305 type:complete len:340 (+) Transcript_32747:65-1084(+)
MSQLSPSAKPFTSGLESEWAAWKDVSSESSAHLNAQYQAEIASKCAADLATYFQSLWGTVVHLQAKVTELEEWKRKALEDVRKLRDEHKALRRKVLGEEQVEIERSTVRAKTMPPQLLAPMVTNSPPPGLNLAKADSPPGLSLPRQDSATLSPPRLLHHNSLSSGHSSFSNFTSASMVSDDGGHLEGVQISMVCIDGVQLERAEWRIGQVSQKLRGCMGRALVSSPFNAAGLEEIRLMVLPEGKETTKGPRSKRQRELYAKKVQEGPLDGCLKLKVPSCPADCELQYFLKVGGSRRGPFRHNFSENTVSGCDDFGVDWLSQLGPDNSLIVCVEFVKELK